jgi:hypothetical protein
MKKRLLITSIVMMLVVAVALSTATYAWFTSNANVTASSISMTAATNGDAALAIKWDTGTYGTAITTTASYTNLAPMIPNQIVAHTTTLGFSTETNNITFQTAKIHTVASDTQFFNITNNVTPFAFASSSTDTPASKDTIFIMNTSTANVITNIKVTAEVQAAYVLCVANEKASALYTYYDDAEGQTLTDPAPAVGADVAGKYKYLSHPELVRIAVFTRDLDDGTDDTTSAYFLRGILASTAADTYFGTISENQSQSTYRTTTANKVSATAAAEGFNICYDGGVAHSLATQGAVAIKVIMWLDGEALTDDTQGAISSVALTFTAV